MKKLSPTVHGYLDYVTVVIFLAAPSLIGLSGLAKTFAYVLAVIHLVILVDGETKLMLGASILGVVVDEVIHTILDLMPRHRSRCCKEQCTSTQRSPSFFRQ